MTELSPCAPDRKRLFWCFVSFTSLPLAGGWQRDQDDNENKQCFLFYVREGRDNLYETLVMSMQLIIATMRLESEQKDFVRFASFPFGVLLFQCCISAQFTMYNKKLFSHFIAFVLFSVDELLGRKVNEELIN